MNDFQGRITALEAAVGSFGKENELLKFKVDDPENRSRRCKIRITGIPERAEGTRPTPFIESFIEELFNADAFPRSLAVDRAHRVAVQRRPDGAPRPFIASALHRLRSSLPGEATYNAAGTRERSLVPQGLGNSYLRRLSR